MILLFTNILVNKTTLIISNYLFAHCKLFESLYRSEFYSKPLFRRCSVDDFPFFSSLFHDERLPFLDIDISWLEGKLTTSVYCKPTLTDLFTNVHSFIPLAYERSIMSCSPHRTVMKNSMLSSKLLWKCLLSMIFLFLLSVDLFFASPPESHLSFPLAFRRFVGQPDLPRVITSNNAKNSKKSPMEITKIGRPNLIEDHLVNVAVR